MHHSTTIQLYYDTIQLYYDTIQLYYDTIQLYCDTIQLYYDRPFILKLIIWTHRHIEGKLV